MGRVTARAHNGNYEKLSKTCSDYFQKFSFDRTVQPCITPELLLLLLHPFNGLFSRTTWVSRYQKGKTSLALNEARNDGVLGWQWHQLDHMQTICTSLQTDNHTNTSSMHKSRKRRLDKTERRSSRSTSINSSKNWTDHRRMLERSVTKVELHLCILCSQQHQPTYNHQFYQLVTQSNDGGRRITKQPNITALIRSPQRLSTFGHTTRTDNDADAKMILTAPPTDCTQNIISFRYHIGFFS